MVDPRSEILKYRSSTGAAYGRVSWPDVAGERGDGDGPDGRKQLLRPLPPLPRPLAEARPVVLVGTIAWFVSAAVLAAAGAGGDWVTTCVTGGLLGLLGFLIMAWQRRAARRGSRGAQRGPF
jgi:hypothetical protein